MSHTASFKVPPEIDQILIDVTDVNKFIMSLDPDERRKFTKELKAWLAMLIVAHRSKGKEPDIQKLSQWLKLGFDKSYAQEEILLGLSASQKNEAIMLTIPQNITILQNGIRIMTRSGIEVYISAELLQKLKQKYGSALQCIKGLIALKVQKKVIQKVPGQQRTIIVATDVKPLVSETVDERVATLYRKYKPIDLYMMLLGIEPNPRTIRIMLPKLLYWFIVENEPIHCAIFEPPETGKTHIAIVMSTVCKFYYTTEPPSRAFFIHDARQKTSESIVSMFNGIILDEAEKTMPKDAQGWEEFLSMCMTGMEQGKWTRSKGYGQTIEKMFTVVLQGNTLETEQRMSIAEALGESDVSKPDPRQAFIQMVRQYAKRLNPSGIASRLTYVTWREDVEPITPHLLNRFAPTPILRGLWRLIQTDIDTVCTQIKPKVKQLLEKLTGKKFGYEQRAFRHVYKVTTMLHVLFRYEVNETLVDLAREMVKFGEIDMRHIEEIYYTGTGELAEEKHVEHLLTQEMEQRETEQKQTEETSEESEPPV